MRLRSRPVSYGPSRRLATMVSVAGWEGPQASGESAVWMPAAPASIAAKYEMGASAVVECEWTLTGNLVAPAIALTSALAGIGARIPATSSIPIQSAPMAFNRLAHLTIRASSTTGLGL